LNEGIFVFKSEDTLKLEEGDTFSDLLKKVIKIEMLNPMISDMMKSFDSNNMFKQTKETSRFQGIAEEEIDNYFKK
jgi:hypothetical protein